MGKLTKKQFSDVFYTCSLIEQIARDKHLVRGDLVEKLGRDILIRTINHADVFHCEPLEKTAFDYEEHYNIAEGIFDNITTCKYQVPSSYDIGKVYARLIECVYEEGSLIDTLMKVYHSPISCAISEYNSDFFYQNPSYIYECYKANAIIE